MKKTLKKGISFILSVLLIVTMISSKTFIFAETILPTVDGDNIIWNYDNIDVTINSSAKTLTVSGKGEMPDFGKTGLPPWMDYSDEIKKIVIEDGVNTIETNSFAFCFNLEKAIIPMSIVSIDNDEFICSDDVDIVCCYDSYAQNYAEDNLYNYKVFGDVSGDKILNAADLSSAIHDLLFDVDNDLDVSDINKDSNFDLLDLVALKNMFVSYANGSATDVNVTYNLKYNRDYVCVFTNDYGEKEAIFARFEKTPSKNNHPNMFTAKTWGTSVSTSSTVTTPFTYDNKEWYYTDTISWSNKNDYSAVDSNIDIYFENTNNLALRLTTAANNTLSVVTSNIGGIDVGAIFEISGFNEKLPNFAESTMDTSWESTSTANTTGGATTQANALRNDILLSDNTEENYSWTGNTIYVSPHGNDNNNGLTPETAVKSLSANAVTNNLSPNNAILFERGGVWRLNSTISTKEGVVYGSYGNGEKPTLLGSKYNYANENYWTASKKQYIWKANVTNGDIGILVFNNGEMVGTKELNGLTALGTNGDFYYNSGENTLYLYCDEGNPGNVYNDIEAGIGCNGFGVSNDNTTIDNFRIKYYSIFGIGMCGNNYTNITNCEIGFIGGAIQSGTTRYGNGIQQWNSVDTLNITHNWVYQTYDTAITWQGKDSYEPGKDSNGNSRVGDKAYYKDITVSNNLVEHNILSFEFWHGATSGTDGVLARVTNFKFINNISRFAGYGWSAKQRPDKVGYDVSNSKNVYFMNASNNVWENNTFDCPARAFIYWTFSSTYAPGFSISNNTFYGHPTMYNESIIYGTYAGTATTQSGLVNSISYFDSNYKKVQFLP